MRNAVFLVKNGIGFGHIRRALLVAEAVQRVGRLRPIIISQASSLALYRDSPVRVINFPLLHRVPSAITEDLYTDLLDRLIDRLNPAVVIEDTYPDARYRRLPALADRPRILVMRRLDGLSFDQIRQRGDLAHYDRILIAQDEVAFQREGHSGDSLAAVKYSGRCGFVGNIAYAPGADEALAVRQAYAPDGAPLVVVNGGAGGDQMPDGYGDRGNNALSETLAGHAHLILVADVSFMEGLDAHAARTVDQYGGTVGTPGRASLEPLIRDALARPPRETRLVPTSSAVDTVVQEIFEQATGAEVSVAPKVLVLVLIPPNYLTPDSLTADLPDGLRNALVFGDTKRDGAVAKLSALTHDPPGQAEAVVWGGDPGPLSPQNIADRGVLLLILPGPAPAADRWLSLQPPCPSLLTITAQRMTAQPTSVERARRRMARLLQSEAAAVLLLDLGGLPPRDLPAYLEALARWLAAQPVLLAGVREMAAVKANRLLEGEPR